MTKQEAINDPQSCWNRAGPDEQVFVLLGRDLAAAAAIQFWIVHRIVLGLNSLGDPQTVSAMGVAETIMKSHVDTVPEK